LIEGRAEEARAQFEQLGEPERGPGGASWVPAAARVYAGALSRVAGRRVSDATGAALAELERSLGCEHPELAAARAVLAIERTPASK
jgi:hypothetical protein